MFQHDFGFKPGELNYIAIRVSSKTLKKIHEQVLLFDKVIDCEVSSDLGKVIINAKIKEELDNGECIMDKLTNKEDFITKRIKSQLPLGCDIEVYIEYI